MNKTSCAIFGFLIILLSGFSEAKCRLNSKLKQKFNDIVFVVYCEDRMDETAMMLVLSTIYNRAQSHEINLLHSEIAKKNQYCCFNMRKSVKKIEPVAYNKAYNLVCDFIKNKRKPITQARYFYNHKLVRPSYARAKTVVKIYGSHTYLR